MNTRTLSLDIAIFGGGIAGLWLLNRLGDAGYTVALFERTSLGDGQTVASQGMIHSGIKYGAGAWRRPAAALAAMPARWRACLEGHGEIDLRSARVLSDEALLWSGSGLPARLGAFIAARLLQGRAQPVPEDARPPLFRKQVFQGVLYRLEDWVLDVPSAIAALAQRWRERIFTLDARGSLRRDARGCAVVDIGEGDSALRLHPRLCLLAAGAGNEQLLAALEAGQLPMRRRPLCQVLVKAPALPPLFGHGLGFGAAPRLTVSSHRLEDGSTVWYLGGQVAEKGAHLSEAHTLALARRELTAAFPQLDWAAAEWATVRAERAEPVSSLWGRTGGACAQEVPGCANAVVAWPLKLTLAPALGDAVLNILQTRGLEPAASPPDFGPLAMLPQPGPAAPPWEKRF